MWRLVWGAMAGCLVAWGSATAHREHKVHNIVLYPDRHSWCQTTPIKQVVAQAGCRPAEIDNHVCVGACFSYSIPATQPSDGELPPYCDSCQPSASTWHTVHLTCDDPDNSETHRRVQIITNCSCSTCPAGAEPGPQGGSSGDGEPGPPLDVHEFLGRGRRNGTMAVGKRVLALLKHFSGEGEPDGELDVAGLRDLLEKVDQATLGEIVRNVEDREHIKVNLSHLKHVLARLERNDTAPRRHHHHEVAPSLREEEEEEGLEAQAEEDEGKQEEEDDPEDPTLDMAPHHFKPAVEGVELSYHGTNVVTGEEGAQEARDAEF